LPAIRISSHPRRSPFLNSGSRPCRRAASKEVTPENLGSKHQRPFTASSVSPMNEVRRGGPWNSGSGGHQPVVASELHPVAGKPFAGVGVGAWVLTSKPACGAGRVGPRGSDENHGDLRPRVTAFAEPRPKSARPLRLLPVAVVLSCVVQISSAGRNPGRSAIRALGGWGLPGLTVTQLRPECSFIAEPATADRRGFCGAMSATPFAGFFLIAASRQPAGRTVSQIWDAAWP